MQISRIDNLDQLDQLKEPWGAAYAADPHATIFVSWTWLRGWFETTPDDWFVLAARPDTTSPYIAFFPLAMDANGHWLQMGGHPWADHTGFVCLPAYEQKAIEAFALFVQQQVQWPRFRMRDVFDPRLDLFLKNFSPKQFNVQKTRGISCPYIPLPDSWEEYLQNSLGRKTRKNLRRSIRRIENLNQFRITHVHEDNVRQQIDTFLKLYQMRWGTKPEHLLERFRTIFQHCFDNDSLWLTVLWTATTPIAANAAFVDRQKKVLSDYLGGWDEEFAPVSPGDALHGYTTQYAIENEFQEFDFLRGDEGYKFSFGSKERFNTDVIITRKSIRRAIKRRIGRLRALLKLNRGSWSQKVIDDTKQETDPKNSR